MDEDEAWRVIHLERAATADLLATLTPQEWEQPSLCEEWTVRDVAAHLIGGVELSAGEMAVAVFRARGSLDRTIRDYARKVSARPTEEIVADYRRLAQSRSVTPGTTYRDSLVDSLVHPQDIAIPLGRSIPLPPHAGREAADQVLRRKMTFRAHKRLAGYRLEATDIEWVVGEGATVRGPMSALLLLVTGRAVALEHLRGGGALRLRRQLGTSPAPSSGGRPVWS